MIALLCALAAGVEQPALELSIAPEVEVRRVSFKDRLTPSLAGYKSGAVALLRAQAAAYPAAGRLPVLGDVGFYGWYARSLKSRTLTSDGALAFDTQRISWEAGARFRLVMDDEERLAVSVGYGSLRSDFSGPLLPGVLLPSGTLQYWRPALEGRLPLGPVVLAASFGGLAVARENAIGAAFPRASSAGIDAAAQGSLLLGPVELALAVKYTRFFYSLHPLPYDPYIAGGALDELWSVDLACVLRR